MSDFFDKYKKVPRPGQAIRFDELHEYDLSGHHGHPRFYELVKEITDVHDRKNQDYRGTEGPVSNFVRLSEIMKLYPRMDWDTPYGTAVFQILKQLDAALALRQSKKESAVGEPISSRMRDIAVLSLLSIVVEEEERK